MTGGEEEFLHDDLVVSFRRWSIAEDPPLLVGRVIAFVPWTGASIDGAELCRRLRCHPHTATAHIFAVLAEEDDSARRSAMRAGATDCLVGPLTRSEVLDRSLALPLSEGELQGTPVIRNGPLGVDVAGFRATWHGQGVPLPANELRLLRFFTEYPGRVFTRSQIIKGLGKLETTTDERTVDVWVGRLRRVLKSHGADCLRTVRDVGYVMDRLDDA